MSKVRCGVVRRRFLCKLDEEKEEMYEDIFSMNIENEISGGAPQADDVNEK